MAAVRDRHHPADGAVLEPHPRAPNLEPRSRRVVIRIGRCGGRQPERHAQHRYVYVSHVRAQGLAAALTEQLCDHFD